MEHMKRKYFLTILTVFCSVTFLCTGCGKNSLPSQDTSVSLEEKLTEESSVTLTGEIKKIEHSEGGSITVPSYLQGEETISLSPSESTEDSVTYQLDTQQQTDILNQLTNQIESSVSQVLSDKKFYPDITAISVNEDCTEFNVTFSSSEITIYETTLRMSLYIAGDKFQLYQGIPEEQISTTVNYIEASNGKVFATGSSADIH